MADREYTPRGDRSGGRGSSRSDGPGDRRGGGGGGDDDDDRRSQGGGRRPFGRRRRKVCEFCERKVTAIDYKDISTLSRHVEQSGHMQSRRRMGTCAKHQRLLSRAIKRARFIALLPFTSSQGH
jgi:small subunit ribosomal protein S18